MKNLLKRITEKKRKLDQFQPLPHGVVKNLEDWLNVELTYSSNRIEGNTLTRIETAEVIEKGVSAVISGKALVDQLEAVNHARAIEQMHWISTQIKSHNEITEAHINSIHKIILTRIDDEWAGRYREDEVFIRGTDVELPMPQRVPYLMKDFADWLAQGKKPHPILIAADAHFKFVSIHPYRDGNGRTARLLMNLILLKNDYPLAIIRAEDRTEYLNALNVAQKKGDFEPFYTIIAQAVERSLDAYLNITEGKPALAPLTKLKREPQETIGPETYGELLKIGELAKETGETVHTLRYWTKLGLLKVTNYSEGGYQLYHANMIKRAEKIRTLQKEQRLPLDEIKKHLTHN